MTRGRFPEDAPPVPFHVDDDPTSLWRRIERARQLADLRLSFVGPLAFGVRVLDEDAEARPRARRGPLQHLEVSVGVTECDQWPTADRLLDPDGLAGLV